MTERFEIGNPTLKYAASCEIPVVASPLVYIGSICIVLDLISVTYGRQVQVKKDGSRVHGPWTPVAVSVSGARLVGDIIREKDRRVQRFTRFQDAPAWVKATVKRVELD